MHNAAPIIEATTDRSLEFMLTEDASLSPAALVNQYPSLYQELQLETLRQGSCRHNPEDSPVVSGPGAWPRYP